MTIQRVSDPGEISLNEVRYRLRTDSKVRQSLASEWVEKQVFGDVGKDSHRDISTQHWNDFAGGIGLERMDGLENNRSWWSTANQRNKRHVTLPALATQTETFQNGRTGAILGNELDGAIVTAVGTSIQSYSGSAWTERHTAAAAPTDTLNLTMDKAGTFTEFLVYCYTSGYAYSDAIATWATSAKNTLKMAYWQNKFWGIDATGQLWFTFTVGSAEVDDAQLPLSHNEKVTGLLTGPGLDQRKTVLYCTTNKGLWRHDFGNRLWEFTDVSLPHNLAATGISRQATTWRGDMCLGANTGFIRYIPDKSTQIVEAILLGHDDGLKTTKEGRVFCMADSIGDLLIGTNVVNSTDSGAIFQWNDMNGFQVLWEADATNTGIDSLHISDAIDNYRCWFGYANRMWWIRIHDSVANPRQVKDWTYSDRDTSNTNPIILETPWFDAEQEEVTKVLLRTRVETQDCNTNEAVRVSFGINYNISFTQYDQTFTTDSTFDATDDRIEGDGITTFTHATLADPKGLEFRSLRYELALRRGSTNTLTPDVISVWIEFLKVLDDKSSFDFDLDLRRGFGGRSARALRTALTTAVESKVLIQLTYRTDDTSGNPRNYWGKITFRSDDEETGFDATGIARLRFREPS